MFGFEKLEVWQKSVELAGAVYNSTRMFPNDERFGLTSQLRRAATSVSANIAEGSGRPHPRDNCRFVEIAYGSLMEVVSLSRVAVGQQFMPATHYESIRNDSERIARMLSGLRTSLQQKAHENKER